MNDSLPTLHASIAERVDSIARAHPDWPCRKGCDACCRHLAAEPQLTEPEWRLVRQALDLLPAASRSAIETRIVETARASRPIVCPMLDQTTGACLIYDHRPVACRTYGFYVERDQGLYCNIIERMSALGELNSIVWGNAEAVERALTQTAGPARPLSEWLR